MERGRKRREIGELVLLSTFWTDLEQGSQGQLMHLSPGHFGPVTQDPSSTLLGFLSLSFLHSGSSLTKISHDDNQPRLRPYQHPPTPASPCRHPS